MMYKTIALISSLVIVEAQQSFLHENAQEGRELQSILN